MRHHLFFSGLILSTAVCLALVSGCGGGAKDDSEDGPPRAKTGSSGGTTGGKKTVVKAGDGVIKGKIVYDGAPPGCALIPETQKTEGCKAPADHPDNCDQKWIVSKDGAVKDVLFFLKAGSGQSFEPGSGKSAAEIDQPYCAFVPHVVALQAGQKLLVKNSASTSHNTKILGNPAKNPPSSVTLKPSGSQSFDLKPESGPIDIVCDVHPWMKAKAWVFDHPYSIVTGEDGTFEIKNVPNDVKITLVGWHDGAGYFHGGEKGTEITLKKGETLDLKVIKIK